MDAEAQDQLATIADEIGDVFQAHEWKWRDTPVTAANVALDLAGRLQQFTDDPDLTWQAGGRIIVHRVDGSLVFAVVLGQIDDPTPAPE